MAINILTGLPGSGKSQTLITQVNAARREGRTTLTFMCSDSAILQARPNIRTMRRMGCRAGVNAALDHFVSSEEAISLLRRAPTNALLAFDEAQHFSVRLVDAWCAANARGADVLIASPSMPQLSALRKHGNTATRLRLLCEACHTREASRYVCFDEEDRTESVCEDCYQRRQSRTEKGFVPPESIDTQALGPASRE